MLLNTEIKNILIEAKDASRKLNVLTNAEYDKAILKMASALDKNSSYIISENKKDMNNANKNNLSAALQDRLLLNRKRIKQMSDSLRQISALKGCVGRVDNMKELTNGLKVGKMRVPIGVIGIIYESRPNVTSDCAGLCLKSGNVVVLRGGKEAIHSNIAIYKILKKAIIKAGLPEGTLNLIKTIDRKAVDIMLKMNKYIDLIIPRGGESLIKNIIAKSKIPVIKHYKGICHTYVDEYADLNMAEKICINAKVQRPGVCNAMETLLVHKDIAMRFLPSLCKKLFDAGVEIRGCDSTRKIFKKAKKAKMLDWSTEYLDMILSVKVVSDLDEAIRHINKFGSMHSEAIVTDNHQCGMEFLKRVDAACVYINASTRFTDGGQFEMGAEIGISTDKIHARGPMGIEELTTYKYIIFGNGQIRK